MAQRAEGEQTDQTRMEEACCPRGNIPLAPTDVDRTCSALGGTADPALVARPLVTITASETRSISGQNVIPTEHSAHSPSSSLSTPSSSVESLPLVTALSGDQCLRVSVLNNNRRESKELQISEPPEATKHKALESASRRTCPTSLC